MIGLAVYGDNIYCTEANAVRACALTGCSNTPITIASDGVAPSGIAVDASGVYWADNALGTLNTCPLTGCTGGVARVLAYDQQGPSAIGLDAGYIYWINEAGGQLVRMPR